MPCKLTTTAARRRSPCARRAQAREIFVSNEKGNSVTVIDGDKLEVKATIPVGNRPRGIVLARTASSSTSAPPTTTRSQIMDIATRKVVGTLPSGPDPEQMVLSADGKTLYIANEDDNMVTVIDIATPQGDRRDPGGRRARGHGRQP